LQIQELSERLPTSLDVVESRDNQQANPSEALPLAIQVQILDQDGDPYTDASESVAWSVLTGGGSIVPSSSFSDENGYASTVWTLGPTLGTQIVRASLAGLDSVTLTAEAVQTVTVDSLVIGAAEALGDSATVEVRLEISAAQAGLQFTLSFSDSLMAEEVTATTRLDSMMVSDSAGLEAGSLVVVVAPEFESPMPTIEPGSSAILYIKFRIASGTPAGSYGLQVTDARVSDTIGVSTAIAYVNGAVIVP
jgi:hypothetical protein